MKRPLAILMAAALLAMPLAAPAGAQGTLVATAAELTAQAETLAPGDWVWAPALSPAGPVTVFVDLTRQTATVYRNGVRIGVSTISSGKPGHETPTGVFVILQKDADHRSNLYDDAPMPFQQRLTWDGIALHAGALPGYPQSHGCIRLPLEFAKRLFGVTEMGGTVIVSGVAGEPAITPAPGLLAAEGPGGVPLNHAPLAGDELYRWMPETAPDGPLTLVISRHDQTLVALRGAAEIGRARVYVPEGETATHVLMLSQAPGGVLHWIQLELPEGKPGAPVATLPPPSPDELADQALLPPAFAALLEPLLLPGTTILITPESLEEGSGGLPLTIVDAIG